MPDTESRWPRTWGARWPSTCPACPRRTSGAISSSVASPDTSVLPGSCPSPAPTTSSRTASASSEGGVPAVDGEDRSGDVGRLRRREEEDRVGDLLGGGEALE